MDKKISDKVINRLTLYHCILSDYINDKIEFISSKQIAQLLNIDDSQVRKDINLLNNSGKCRVGYIVKELKISIEKTLGFKKTKKAFDESGKIRSSKTFFILRGLFKEQKFRRLKIPLRREQH